MATDSGQGPQKGSDDPNLVRSGRIRRARGRQVHRNRHLCRTMVALDLKAGSRLAPATSAARRATGRPSVLIRHRSRDVASPPQDRRLLFCRNRRAVRAAHRLSHPKASRRNRGMKALHINATKILRHQQVFALDVCTVQLKDITEEVLKSPRRLKTATARQDRELKALTRLQFADGLQLPDLTITGLADTGCEAAGVIGTEVLRAHLKALHSAKIPVILLTAGKTALAGGTQGVTVTLSLPVITPEGNKVFKCLNVFLHVAAVGPRLISGYPFPLAFGLAVVPGQEALVQVPGCFKGFRVPRYQHGNPQAVQHSAPSLQRSEVRQLTDVSTIEHESRADVPEATNADTRNGGVHLAHHVQFAPDVSCQWCVMCEDPCSRVHFLYDAQQPATCEQSGPVYTPVGVLNKCREGVRKNMLFFVLPCDLDHETAILPPPDLPTPRRVPGTRSQDTKRADGLRVYPSPLVYEDQPLPSSTVVQPAAQEVTLASLIEKHAAAHPLKVKLLSEHAVLPTRGSSSAAGFDLYAP